MEVSPQAEPLQAGDPVLLTAVSAEDTLTAYSLAVVDQGLRALIPFPARESRRPVTITGPDARSAALGQAVVDAAMLVLERITEVACVQNAYNLADRSDQALLDACAADGPEVSITPERRQDGRSSSAPDYGIPRCGPGSPGTRMARYCDTNPMTTVIAKLVASGYCPRAPSGQHQFVIAAFEGVGMGAHRVTSLVREVPDLRLTRAFYTEFGLRETSPGRFATEVGGEQLVLRAGDAPRVVELNIGVDAEADLDAIAQRFGGLGIASARTAAGLEATEPVSGVLAHVAVAARLPKDPPPSAPTSIDRNELVLREPIRPLRLGHVAIGCTDVEEAKRFFLDGIGMRLSDYVIGGPFMRFETDHHNVVLLPAPMTLLHHTAWRVRNVDEIGYGGSRMIENHPERHAWGLGRHAASANYFWYLKDPAGAFSEYYYSEMDDLADTPYFWDPSPDSEELPVAAWASPALQDRPLVPEAMRAPILTAGE